MGSLDDLAREIADMKARIAALENRSLVIPVLDADPDVNDPCSLWAFNDGRLRWRKPGGTVVQISTAASTGTTSTVALPAAPAAEQTFDDTRMADWAATYDGDGLLRDIGSMLPYGNDPVFGQQKVMMSFQSWAPLLAGADIEGVELIVENLRTEGSTGGIIFFGTHALTAQPANYEALATGVFSVMTPPGITGRYRLSPTFAEQIRDGEITGFVIEQPNSSRAYAGAINRSVYLRIVYVK